MNSVLFLMLSAISCAEAGWFGPTEFKSRTSNFVDLTNPENEKHADAVEELISLGTDFHIPDRTRVSTGTLSIIYDELGKARKDPLWWQHNDGAPDKSEDDDQPAAVAAGSLCSSHAGCGAGKFCGAADDGEKPECYGCSECEADGDGITPCKAYCAAPPAAAKASSGCSSHAGCGAGKFCGAADDGEKPECYECYECEADGDGITPCKKHCLRRLRAAVLGSASA